MLTGIAAYVASGYTSWDHLIDRTAEDAATDAVAGKQFRRSADALRAAQRAFEDASDRRVHTAKVWVQLRTARGDVVSVGR